MQILSLTPLQQARLDGLKEASFSRHCLRHGYDEKKRKAQLLKSLQADLLRFCDDAGAPPTFTLDFMRPVLETDDYWIASQIIYDSAKKRVVKDLISTAYAKSSLPINFDYLDHLALEIGATRPSPSDPVSLETFLLSIPWLELFDLEFNAFVSRETIIDEMPCICVYDQLLIATTAFIEVILPVVVERHPDGTFDPATVVQVNERAKNPEFQEACSSCLELVLGKSSSFEVPTLSILASYQPNGIGHRLTNIVVSGAENFVRYHEYGHLLMGHLSVQASHEIEFYADYFANAVIATNPLDQSPAREWKAIGGIITIMLLAIIEAKNPIKSASHPPAIKRLAYFIDCWPEHLRISYMEYAHAIAEACNPTLHARWGCAVSI